MRAVSALFNPCKLPYILSFKYDSSYDKKDDNDITNEILNAYKWNWQIPNDKVKVKVENGWVTLDGDLNWNYQKSVAKDAVSKGVFEYLIEKINLKKTKHENSMVALYDTHEQAVKKL